MRSGTAAALTLRARGEQVVGVDSGAPDTAALAAQGVEVHTGVDGLALLERVRAVVKSPGVPREAPVIAAARDRGLPVIGELELAWRLLENDFIAVTGTNGKTTTTELLGHILREAALPVAVAGNVGTAVASLVGELAPDATVVCEASSFQLEDTEAFAPEAAMLLNVAPDHLDRHGTMDDYTAAKLQAFARQGNDDVAVAPGRPRRHRGPRRLRAAGAVRLDAAGRARRSRRPALVGRRSRCWVSTRSPARARTTGSTPWPRPRSLLARGVDPDAVRAGLRTFAGVAHRLEEVGRRDGVLYVNDSKATNPASTVVALRIVRAGERARDPGWAREGRGVRRARGAGARALRPASTSSGRRPTRSPRISTPTGVALERCGDLERAVAAAGARAGAGETVLLSPACASFDQYADFEQRGDHFRALVHGA